MKIIELKYLKLFFILAFVFLSSFIKKDKQITNPLKGLLKKKETIVNSKKTIEEYYYDSLGKIIKVTGENNAITALIKYPSKQKILIDLIINYNNKIQIHRDVFLNPSLLPDSTFQVQFNEEIKDTSIERYFYNNPFAVKHSFFSVNNPGNKPLEYTSYLYDSIGNVLQETSYDESMLPKEITHYTYCQYYDNVNVGLLSFIHVNPFLPLKKQLFNSNNKLIETTIYSYTFDDKNILKTEFQTVNGEIIKTINYTYY